MYMTKSSCFSFLTNTLYHCLQSGIVKIIFESIMVYLQEDENMTLYNKKGKAAAYIENDVIWTLMEELSLICSRRYTIFRENN